MRPFINETGMARENLNDIVAFLTVARAKSFTKAAAQLGVSQSALSHTIRGLEARMGLKLLTRTTRSVAPTQAGERLLNAVGPHFEDIQTAIDALGELRDKPAGTVRITAGLHATETILWPKLQPLLRKHPDVKLELIVDYALTNIVADRFDAGVRLGEQVAKDMFAVRIGPDFRMVVVASPAYFANRPPPRTPQDLTGHDCINLRFPTHGNLYVWEFERGGRELNVRIDGQLTFNTSRHILEAALAGFGVAYLPEDTAAPHIARGKLVQALDAWCAPFAGYHLYYPTRRQSSPALSLVIDALRYARK
jgi:DNA-binding transcriptional LysR family regulator